MLQPSYTPVFASRLHNRTVTTYVAPGFDVGRWNEIDRERFFQVMYVTRLPDPTTANGMFWEP